MTLFQLHVGYVLEMSGLVPTSMNGKETQSFSCKISHAKECPYDIEYKIIEKPSSQVVVRIK